MRLSLFGTKPFWSQKIFHSKRLNCYIVVIWLLLCYWMLRCLHNQTTSSMHMDRQCKHQFPKPCAYSIKLCIIHTYLSCKHNAIEMRKPKNCIVYHMVLGRGMDWLAQSGEHLLKIQRSEFDSAQRWIDGTSFVLMAIYRATLTSQICNDDHAIYRTKSRLYILCWKKGSNVAQTKLALWLMKVGHILY